MGLAICGFRAFLSFWFQNHGLELMRIGILSQNSIHITFQQLCVSEPFVHRILCKLQTWLIRAGRKLRHNQSDYPNSCLLQSHLMDEVQKGEGAIHSLPPQISEETGIKLNFCVPVPKAHVVVYPIISVAILALVIPVTIKQSPTQ